MDIKDREYMRQALDLAELGRGRVTPNPLVGAVIVKDGQVIGKGWHQKAGTPHAEIHALNDAGENSRGATLYVTLEPCCHTGKTPPCTEAIIRAGIKKVFAAMEDPNPLVAGKGFYRLQEAGIEVESGLLNQEARHLNEVFIKNMTDKMPFIAMKTAATLDGKTATKTGDSKWITGCLSRERVHRLRSYYDAIMTGIGTVEKDDPQMTVRLGDSSPQPLRIVIDYNLEINERARICDTKDAHTMIITNNQDPDKAVRLKEIGVELLVLEGKNGLFDLRKLLQMLYERGVMSIFLEAGAGLNAAFLHENLIDKYYVFLAPKLIGGDSAPGIFSGEGISCMNQSKYVTIASVEEIDGDWLFTAYPKRQQ